jgi:hypothetical protein
VSKLYSVVVLPTVLPVSSSLASYVYVVVVPNLVCELRLPTLS